MLRVENKTLINNEQKNVKYQASKNCFYVCVGKKRKNVKKSLKINIHPHIHPSNNKNLKNLNEFIVKICILICVLFALDGKIHVIYFYSYTTGTI